MKMDKKLKLRGEELNSPPGALPLDPAGGSRPPFRLARAPARSPRSPFGANSGSATAVGSGSEVPEAEHVAITIHNIT